MPEGKQSIRAFVSIHIPTGIREKLNVVQAELARTLPDSAVRWAPLEQLHLTLEFLGNIATEDLPQLENDLTKVGAGHRSFDLSVERIGAFSSVRNPRVIWAGIEGNVDAVKALQRDVKGAVRQFVTEEETRAYRPHVTLGRVRPIKPRELRRVSDALASAADRSFGAWPVKEFALMQSKLSPHGSQHSALATLALGG
jgi:RNA 2',3'-cyclic 3'-phosphodiesterase